MKSLARYLWNFIEDHESWQPLLNRYKEFRVGTTREWHSNGQLALEVNYVMGRKDGLEKRWYRNGERQSVVNYKMDSIVVITSIGLLMENNTLKIKKLFILWGAKQ